MDNQEKISSYLAGIYTRISEQVELQKEQNECYKAEHAEARFFRRFIIAWLVVGYYIGIAFYVWILWKVKQHGYAIGLAATAILIHMLIYKYAASNNND
ncbi:MAG: hypothetical protein IJB64_10525 [Akkermansia sp.]|nr:hypothetical protein [Akkermansia sp.]